MPFLLTSCDNTCSTLLVLSNYTAFAAQSARTSTFLNIQGITQLPAEIAFSRSHLAAVIEFRVLTALVVLSTSQRPALMVKPVITRQATRRATGWGAWYLQIIESVAAKAPEAHYFLTIVQAYQWPGPVVHTYYKNQRFFAQQKVIKKPAIKPA